MDDLNDKFQIGEWRIEPPLLRMTRNDDEHQVDRRTMDVLVCLASRSSEVVSRDDLVAAVWGESTFVSENTVSQSVSRLRKALDDDWRDPRFIETISKTGYRLMVPVEMVPVETVPVNTVPVDPVPVDKDPAVMDPDQETGSGQKKGPEAFAVSQRPKALGLGLLGVVMLIVLTGAAIWSRSRIFPRTEFKVDPLPALTSIGNERSAKLSPDGGRIAYAWAGDGDNYEIYIHELDSGNRVRLTEHPAHDDLPVWSPDGRALAFVRGSPEFGCVLFKKSILGGLEERLGDCTEPRGLDWSPDGRWLAFTNKAAPEAPYRLVLHDLETGEQRDLTDPDEGTSGDWYPAFSPDSRQIAFRRSGVMAEDIYLIPTQGGALTRVTSDAGADYRGHDWTPDGREIVMASNRHGRMALWHLPIVGGPPRRLPLSDLWLVYPSFAVTRNRMIYERVADVVDLWTLSLDGSPGGEEESKPEETLLHVSSTRSEINPRISPDGQRLAFTSNRTGVFEIWTANRDGGDAVRHTNFGGALVSSPFWSPDGRHLVFDADAEGDQKDLYLVASDSRAPRRLTINPAEERSPTYSRDGRFIYFASTRGAGRGAGGWQIWKMPAGGGEAAQVTENGGFRALEGPDGEYLYYSKREAVGIWRRPLAGGEENQLVTSSHAFDWATWEVGRRGIYFVVRWPTHICLYRFSDGEVVQLFKPDREVSYSTPAMTLADDEKTLIFAKVKQSEDETMVVDLGQ